MLRARRDVGLVKRSMVEIPLILYKKLERKCRLSKKSINQLLSEHINPWLETMEVQDEQE